MKLIGIKSSDAYYISDNIENKDYFNTNLERFKVNGTKIERSFHKDWFKCIGRPEAITYPESGGRENFRYELREPERFPGLRQVWPPAEAQDEDGDPTGEFAGVASLYVLRWDDTPPQDKPVEFELTEVAEIDRPVPSPVSWERKGDFDMYTHDYRVIKIDPSYSKIEQIITPSLLLTTRPCKLTSKESYEIVRKHVRNNIDPRWAHISSDYDFCFEVQKLFRMPVAKEWTVDVNNGLFQKRKRKPKYEKRFQAARSVTVFKMGQAEHRYQGYEPVEGFTGTDHADLERNVNEYLAELMAKINQPLKDCPHCAGAGVVLDDTDKPKQKGSAP